MPEIKRLNYFNGQFLRQDDFNDEQAYHVDMRRRHNATLHTAGIADGGLEITQVNNKQVSVGAGMAFDRQGREIVLLTPQTVDLAQAPVNSDVFITIEYQQTPSDPPPNNTDPTLFTRWTEQPKVTTTTTQPTDGSAIVLAKVHLDASGNITNIDPSVRTIASSKIGSSLQLTSLSVSGNARFNLPPGGAPNDFRIHRADSRIALLVRNNGNVGIGTNSPTEKLQFEDMAANSNVRITRKAAASDAPGNVPSSLSLTIVDGAESGVFIVNDRNAAGTANNQYIRFVTHEGGVPSPESMRIAPNGNVGIGTTAPRAPLTIRAQGTSEQLIAFEDPAGKRTWHIVQNVGGNTPGLNFTETDVADGRLFLKPGGNVGIGTTNPQATLHVAGSIKSPMWNVSEVFLDAAGPLPRTGPLSSLGGRLLIFVSGSGFHNTGGFIGMQIKIDNQLIGTASSFVNPAQTHKSFSSTAMVASGIAQGNHSITLETIPGTNTRTDNNDRFSVTILELPFP